VDAVLRRSPERPRSLGTLVVVGRTIDFERREVRFDDGRREGLTEREAEVLHYLAANPGRAIARDELLARVWGIEPRGLHTRTVDMHVARLRERLGDDPDDPKIILTVRARGYMLARESPP
jgi:DNA-binding response OmpR family regulator